MKWLRNTVVAAIALLASCLPAPAQTPVTVVGAVQPGHCVSFFSTTQIQDTGAGCGLGGGGVSSVGLSLPANTFSVTGSPVTTSGTLVGSLINQSPNTFFAGPSTGGATSPTWRAITSTDLPMIAPAQGGTGLANPTAHSLLIAEGAANFNLITATSAGRMILDQGSGLDWAPVAMSADCTLIATGAITCTKTNGTAFGTFATQNYATPPAIGGTTPNAGTFSTLSATSITDTGITGSTQCLQVNSAGLISGIGAACSAVGPVGSVSNADGTLTISPTTGNVIASLALGHANTWTGAQTFSSGLSASAITDTGITGSTQCVQASAAGLLSGTGSACGSGSGAVNSVTNSDGSLTISPTTGAVVASLNVAHANTWTANQTISGASFGVVGNQSAPSWTTHGIKYANVPATLTDTSSTGTVAAEYTGFFGGNTIAASNVTTFTNYYEYYYTAPIPGSNVTFTNSWALGADSLRIANNATIAGALTINTLSSPLSLANGGTNASLTASNGGIVYSTASAFAVLAGTATANQCLLSGSSAAPSWGACPGAVSSVSNSDGTLTISPTTGAVVASLALGHANIWTAAQTFNNSDIILKGSSTGTTTFTSANAGASNFTITVPAVTDTLAVLATAQTFSAGQTFSSSVTLSGATGGALVSCLGLTAANLVATSAGACGTATGGGNPTTVQKFLSGSGTYTTPTNPAPRWIEIELQGGGGGGAGGATTGGSGSQTGGNGGDTCWNTTGAACTSPVYDAGGGVGSVNNGSLGGAGGVVSGSGTCNKAIAGATGGSAAFASNNETGGQGGSSPYGGGGGGSSGASTPGAAGATNTGGGGGGGATNPNLFPGGGGGAGAYCRVIIATPAPTYTYAVGAAGTAGAAGTSGSAGGAGGSGLITVYEYYGSGGAPGGASSNVQYNAGSGTFGGNAGFTYDATSKIGLGVAGTSVGGVQLFNATSGSITLQPTTGALGAVTATLPANTGTIAELNLAQTWSATQTFAAISATAVTDTALASAGTQCVQANTSGVLSGTGSACGSGSGAVSSVTNADGTLTISPTTGAVVASLNLGNANTWTAIQTFTNSDIKLLGSSTGATTFTSANAGASNFTATVPANTGTIAELNLAQTWTAVQTHNSGNLVVAGATSGTLTLNCAGVCGSSTATFPANTGTVAELNLAQTWSAAQSFTNADLIMLGATSGQTTLQATAVAATTTATFPANTGTVAELNLAQTWTAVQTHNSGDLVVAGATSGTLTINCAAVCGANTITFPAGTTNFSATGGASQYLKQTSAGGAITVGTIATGDLTPAGSTTQVQYNSSGAFGASAGFVFDGTSKITLGVAGTSVGGVAFANATSGSITLNPATGALGAVTATLPANTGTIAETNLAQTWTAAQTHNSGNLILAGATSGTTTLNAAAVAGATTATLPANTGTIAETNLAQTWSAIQTYNNNDIVLLGSSTGGTTFSSANAGASSFTITFPAATGTVALTSGVATSVSNADGTLTISPTTGAVVASLALGHANTWTAIQTFNNSDIVLLGSSTGGTTFTSANASATAYTLTIPANTGTLAELNLAQTFSAAQTFSSSLTFSGVTTGTQVSCLGLTAGNLVATSTGACGTGGGGTPGGSNTQVQFNNSGSFGGDSGFTYAGIGQATLALGTITTNLKALNITATWNSIATTAASGTGTTATLTFAAQPVAPVVGSTITVAGVTPGGYNGTFAVTASSTTTVSYANATTGAQTVAGTITTLMDAPLFMNITNTASGGGSAVFEFQVGSATAIGYFIGKNIQSRGNFGAALQVINPGGGQSWALYPSDQTANTGYINGGVVHSFDGPVQGVNVRSVASYPFGGWAQFAAQAQDVMAQTRGTNAQTFRVYNTTDTDNGVPTNYERGVFDWTTSSNVLTIGTQAGGTGSNRAVTLTSAIGVSLSLATAKVATFGDGAANANGWMQWAGEARVTSDFSVTSSTALTNVTGLSVSVAAGRTYTFQTELFVTDAAAGGVQAAIAGTATATAIQYTGYTIADNAIKAKTNATALATAVGSTVTTETAGIIVHITGTITVNAAGTLTVQMAQNTSNATATIAKRGSYMLVQDMP
jgi:hypothetical protein